MVVVVIIDLLGFGILIPLVPYMGDRFGAPPELITPIIGSYSLFQLIGAPLWGRLSDRFGRRPILIISLAGACVSYALLGFATSVAWLVVSRVLGGFMAGNISAALAYASDMSRPDDRAKSLGMVGAGIGIGFTLGPAVGGLLAGNDPATANFMAPAIASMALSVIAILLVTFLLPESHTAEHRAALAKQSHMKRSPFQLLASRKGLRFVTIAALLVTISAGILESIFAIWALDKYGFGPRNVGLLMFVLALIPVIMQGGLIRVLVPRFGEFRIAEYGIAAYVIGFVVVAWNPSLFIAIAGLALCGAGAGAFNPSGSAIASKQADPANRGVVMGTYQSSTSLGRVIGPFLSGPAYAAFGASAPFLLGAMITWPAALLIGASRRARSSRE